MLLHRDDALPARVRAVAESVSVARCSSMTRSSSAERASADCCSAASLSLTARELTARASATCPIFSSELLRCWLTCSTCLFTRSPRSTSRRSRLSSRLARRLSCSRARSTTRCSSVSCRLVSRSKSAVTFPSWDRVAAEISATRSAGRRPRTRAAAPPRRRGGRLPRDLSGSIRGGRRGIECFRFRRGRGPVGVGAVGAGSVSGRRPFGLVVGVADEVGSEAEGAGRRRALLRSETHPSIVPCSVGAPEPCARVQRLGWCERPAGSRSTTERGVRAASGSTSPVRPSRSDHGAWPARRARAAAPARCGSNAGDHEVTQGVRDRSVPEVQHGDRADQRRGADPTVGGELRRDALRLTSLIAGSQAHRFEVRATQHPVEIGVAEEPENRWRTTRRQCRPISRGTGLSDPTSRCSRLRRSAEGSRCGRASRPG